VAVSATTDSVCRTAYFADHQLPELIGTRAITENTGELDSRSHECYNCEQEEGPLAAKGPRGPGGDHAPDHRPRGSKGTDESVTCTMQLLTANDLRPARLLRRAESMGSVGLGKLSVVVGECGMSQGATPPPHIKGECHTALLSATANPRTCRCRSLSSPPKCPEDGDEKHFAREIAADRVPVARADLTGNHVDKVYALSESFER
jgi:hypothetical protein